MKFEQEIAELKRIQRDPSTSPDDLRAIPKLIECLTRDELRRAELAMGEAATLPYVSAAGCER